MRREKTKLDSFMLIRFADLISCFSHIILDALGVLEENIKPLKYLVGKENVWRINPWALQIRQNM